MVTYEMHNLFKALKHQHSHSYETDTQVATHLYVVHKSRDIKLLRRFYCPRNSTPAPVNVLSSCLDCRPVSHSISIPMRVSKEVLWLCFDSMA